MFSVINFFRNAVFVSLGRKPIHLTRKLHPKIIKPRCDWTIYHPFAMWIPDFGSLTLVNSLSNTTVELSDFWFLIQFIRFKTSAPSNKVYCYYFGFSIVRTLNYSHLVMIYCLRSELWEPFSSKMQHKLMFKDNIFYSFIFETKARFETTNCMCGRVITTNNKIYIRKWKRKKKKKTRR